ncbi:MAG: BamA/TamA family outer membrane protein [Amoebophilaceae bacterium]|jgi:outer membrane protein insertion porin family|nr:BamA/TamA family outer membrane protein [Amoebophilaceae bacterium]
MKENFYRTALVQFVANCVLAAGALAQPKPTFYPLELNYAAPATYLIEDVQITGAKSLDKEAIVTILGLGAGDTVQIPGSAIADAMRRLWQQKLFSDVAIHASQVDDHRVILTVSITESPRLLDYSFEGVSKGEQEKLIEKIKLVKGEVVTEGIIKNTQKIIENYWVAEGYLYTTVTITSVPDPVRTAYTCLHIRVDKGEKLSVNAIHFEGNQHVSSDVLKSQMQHIRERPRFTLVKDILKQVLTLQPIRARGVLWHPFSFQKSWSYLQKHVILFPSKFNEAEFAEEKKRIVSYYQSEGFRDAAVIEDKVCRRGDTLLDVWMKVREGKKYYVGAIKWVGNYLYDDCTLNQILKIRTGDVYDPTLLQKRLYRNPEGQDVASLYVDNGYCFFYADPVEVGLRDDKVDLEINIQEGPQASVNKILIEGNKVTHDDVIRRELRTLPGDKFSSANLQRSYRELAQLNIFDPAIDIRPIPNATDKIVDIQYKVKERPKFEAKLGGGWGGKKFMGELSLATNNFSLGNFLKFRPPIGGGQTLGLKAETNGKEYRNYALQFTEPWLGGKKPRHFHLSLNKASEGKRGSVGGNTSLGMRLSWPDDYVVLKGSIAYYRHNYKDYYLLYDEVCNPSGGESNSDKKGGGGVSKSDNRKIGGPTEGILNDLSFDISLERDSTGPSPIYPKEGSRLELHANFTPPWSWLFNKRNKSLSQSEKYRWKEYHQWMLDGSYFFRLLDDLVLNVRGHFGVLGSFPSQSNIGPFSRFYIGGSGFGDRALKGKERISLRGYEEGYITPEDKVSGYQGGVIYDKFVLELRYPMISSHFASAYALVFAEGGNAWAQYEDYDFFSLKRSAGVGFRVYLPFIVGTVVGLDWGYGFDKKKTDKGYNEFDFHFSIGVNLR